MFRRSSGVVVVVLGWALGCAGVPGAPSVAPGSGKAPGPSVLRKGLEGGCYGQPGTPFDKSNFVEEPVVFVDVGDPAWDFTLKDLDGRAVTLSDLLDSKPVLLLTGSYTCPVYRKKGGKIDELVSRLGEHVHVVIVYGPEAHPKSDNSPYRGDYWGHPHKFSHVDLATTYDERVEHVSRIGRAKGVIELVEPLDNPFWCTYGTAPNAGYLVTQEGRFEAVHDWFDPPTMVGSIQALTGAGGERRGGRKKRRKR